MKRLIVLVLFMTVIGGDAAVALYEGGGEPFRGYQASEQFVDIPQGTGSRGIGERLVQAGVVRDHLTFRLALWMTGRARHLQAGEYRFDRAMTPAEVVDK